MVRLLEERIEADAETPAPWEELRRSLEACVPGDWREAVLHEGLMRAEPAEGKRGEAMSSLLARARALAAVLREPSPRSPSGEDARAALERVLAREEFRRAPPSAGFWAWLSRVTRWGIAKLLELLGMIGPTGFLLSRLMLMAVYCGICGLFIYFLVRRLRESRADGPALATASSHGLEADPGAPDHLREEGDRLAAEGRWLEALAAWRFWVLKDLDRRGLLSWRGTDYHRDFLAQARNRGAPAEDLASLRRLFADYDRARFGYATPDASSSAAFRGAAVALTAREVAPCAGEGAAAHA